MTAEEAVALLDRLRSEQLRVLDDLLWLIKREGNLAMIHAAARILQEGQARTAELHNE